MATKSSKLQIVIAGDNKGAVRAIEGTERSLTGLQGQVAGLSNAQRGLGIGLSAAAVGLGAKSAVDAASNLAEQQTKVSTVFGESSAAVEEFAENAAESIGQSERSALEATGTFGNLFTAIGLTQGKSAEMSITMTRLASDLASFNNIEVDEALTALRAGLVGETEPLKRLGVNLNEAALKAKALELGLGDGKAVLTASAKAQAAYALILEQTTTAQGDFDRTADGLANSQRKATAEWENAKAALGEELIPVFKTGTQVLTDLLGLTESIPGPVRTAGVAFTGLALGIGLIGPPLARGVDLMRSLGASAVGAASGTSTLAAAELTASEAALAEAAAQEQLVRAWVAGTPAAAAQTAAVQGLSTAQAGAATSGTAASASTSKFSGALGLLGPASAAAALGFGAYSYNANLAKENAAALEAATDALASAMRGAGSESEALAEFLAGNITPEVASVLEDAGVGIDDLKVALEGGDEAWAKYIDGVDGFLAREVLERLREVTEGARADLAQTEKNNRDLGISADETADSLHGEAAALDDVESAADKATKAFEDLRKRQTDIADAETGVVEAHAESEQATADLAEARRAAAGQSEEYADAQRAISDAVEQVGERERSRDDAVRDAAEAQSDLNRIRGEAKVRLLEMAQATRDAALAEEDARLKVKESEQELERKIADPRATALERERAELELKKAREDARQAAEDNARQQTENAQAQKAGVDGDRAVVDGRNAVAEANRKTEAAERDLADARTAVGEAERNAAKVLDEARGRVAEAVKRSEDAVIKEAEAWYELGEAQGGPLEGAQAYRQFLKDLAEDLDPSSPLAKRVQQLLVDIDRAVSLARTVEGRSNGTIPSNAPAGGRVGAGANESPGGSGPQLTRSAVDGPAGNSVSINVTQNLQGTPTQQHRAAANAVKDVLDKAFRGGR